MMAGKYLHQLKIVGYNVLVFTIYTITCALKIKDDWYILDIFLIAIHFLACVIFSIMDKNLAWLLSALIVLVIGLSTCVGMFNFSGL